MSAPLRSLRRALTCRSAALLAPDRFTSARQGRACEDGSAHTCLLIAVSVLTFVFKYRLTLEQFETFSLLVPADDSLTLVQPACERRFCKPLQLYFSANHLIPLPGVWFWILTSFTSSFLAAVKDANLITSNSLILYRLVAQSVMSAILTR